MRRRALLTGAGAAALAGTAGAGWWLRERPPVPAATEVSTGTTTIIRTDLSTTTTMPGTLGFVGAYEVYGAAADHGTVTWLPQPGQVVNRGEPVYAVDNRPVRLFIGDRPAWRALSSGVTAGPDVQAVEANLVALGHATAANLTVDATFNQATAAALRRWQRATGQPVTGRLELGAVSFQPGPLRVTTVTAKVGAPAGGSDPLLSGTSNTAAVTLDVPVSRTHLVHPNDAVRVTLPDGKKVTGKVGALSTVASTPPENNMGRQDAASVPATVTLDNPAAAGTLDQAPVQVDITSGTVTGVLAVPVTALVALAGGGYGLYLVENGTRRLVGVTPGLFSDTLVQVDGPDLREGATVEVPAV
ncbi:peptidoglycan-binding protein [Virgisporangium aurantiacum]|uniref:Peptidoglycan-binding protein n=1 Tax=Virgisporangium aurantiacum TaxID=175570 RepID=A0A8J4DY22_9ACTN|nr:peptidoglycan-binding protein [Virgisporangium aurantiacum]GIJ54176.1 peptidoglycan-binding protein [Virgisporangium aurantiacum]